MQKQRGPTAFDLRAILQKRDNLRVTSNKVMHKTAVSQDLKLKKGRELSVSLKLLHNSKYCKNLLQIPVSVMPMLEAFLTLSFLHQYQC